MSAELFSVCLCCETLFLDSNESCPACGCLREPELYAAYSGYTAPTTREDYHPEDSKPELLRWRR